MTTGSRRFLLPALALAVSLALALVIGEIAARIVSARSPRLHAAMAAWDLRNVKVEAWADHGFRPKAGAAFDYPRDTRAHANAEHFRGPLVAAAKPAGTYRIILLGGSTTHGWGVNDDQTIDHYLRDTLQRRHPDRRIEVVNLAFDGYDAFQLLQRVAHQGLQLDPDLIILNTGINDVAHAKFDSLAWPDVRALMWEDVLRQQREEEARGGPTLKTRIKRISYLVRLVGVARSGAQRTAARIAPQTAHPDAADYFTRGVDSIAALARARGIPMILSTPPSSLRSKYQPADTSSISYWIVNAERTQQYRDTLAGRLMSIAHRDAPRVVYLSHQLDPSLFLDDCHLTPDGNRTVAMRFAAMVDSILARSPARTSR